MKISKKISKVKIVKIKIFYLSHPVAGVGLTNVNGPAPLTLLLAPGIRTNLMKNIA